MKLFFALFFLFNQTISLAGEIKENAHHINFIFHNSYDFPLIKLNASGNIESGILKEIAIEISRHLNKPHKFILTSRGRIDQMLLDGIADLSCYARREWTATPEDFLWSEPIFNIEELVVYKSTSPPIDSILSLKNKRLGTLINYKYPEVENALGPNSFIADSAINMIASFEKLIKDRVQYIFTDSMYYYNLKKEIYLNHKVNLDKFVLSKAPIHCRLSKKSQIKIENLNSTIITLKKNNFFENIIKKYSPAYQTLETHKSENSSKIALN